jgi:hypothetical protein
VKVENVEARRKVGLAKLKYSSEQTRLLPGFETRNFAMM